MIILIYYKRDVLNNLDFEKRIESLNISKKKFSDLTNLPYQTIMNWKRNETVPIWIESWLEYYTKAKSYTDIKNKIFEIESIDK